MLNIQKGDTLYRVNFEHSDNIEEILAADVKIYNGGKSLKVFLDDEHTEYAMLYDWQEFGYIYPSSSRVYPDTCFTYDALKCYIDDKINEAQSVIDKYEQYKDELIKLKK